MQELIYHRCFGLNPNTATMAVTQCEMNGYFALSPAGRGSQRALPSRLGEVISKLLALDLFIHSGPR